MIIKNKSNGKIIASRVLWCEDFISKTRGLMFKRIDDKTACVLVNKNDDILNSSIHMLFVPQPLSIIWVNSDYKVVGVKKCPQANIINWWRIYYPPKPAKYVIEVLNHHGTIIGDELRFIR